jgi:adenine-specific DNA-methyltransferase
MLKEVIENNAKVKPNSEFLNELQQHFSQFFDIAGNFNNEKFTTELNENNIAESKDGYRLSFVGKDYARLQTGRASETLIQPDIAHNSKKENTDSQNIFITGDNLEALRHLQNTYRNKVKMIYIDPPYNTGKEFVYNDKFEFADENLKSALGYNNDEIERLKSIQGKSSHSAWLTFMYPRLKLAQKLLTDDGVIFVSIDDNEQANLKLLMDDVFGEGNFVIQFTWRKKAGGANDSSDIAGEHEYILCYGKGKNGIYKIPLSEERIKEYKYEDDKVKTHGKYTIKNLNDKSLQDSVGLHFDIVCPDGTILKGKDNQWKCNQETFNRRLDDDRIVFNKKSNGEWVVNYKIYLNEEKGELKYDENGEILTKGRNQSSIILDALNKDGNDDMKDLFPGNKIFDYPKPINLIKKFLLCATKQHDIIFDFFAGSATTAHAVMQLNAEDGGNRKFIMVQLDEETNPDSEARKAGYKTIDEISRERIKRAAKKIKSENPMFAENLDLGFKHYRLISPTVETLDKITEFSNEDLFSVDMISEMGGLETILTTWLIDGGNTFDAKIEEIVLPNYTAQYVAESKTLYLINEEFNTEALKALLNKIGKCELAVSTIVVYPYSFGFETMRELEIGIKSLDNTPQIIKKY